MEHAMQNYSLEEQEMIKKSYLAIYGEDAEGNPLRHTVTIAPTLETNITGMARTIGGLRTSIQELNNPCGKHNDVYIPTSGEIFNDYEYGQATGEYSHFEGQNAQEEIGIGYSVNNSTYKLLVEKETASILNTFPDYPYVIGNQINPLEAYNSSDNNSTMCAPAVVVRFTEDIEYLTEIYSTVYLYKTDNTKINIEFYSIAATGEILASVRANSSDDELSKLIIGETYKIKKEDGSYINVIIDGVIMPGNESDFHFAKFTNPIT
jgi:hypothetical protein